MSTDKVILSLFTIFIVFNNFPTTNSLKNKNKPCQQFTACKCIFPTGRGVNLTPIVGILSAQAQPVNTSISLQLCEDVSFGNMDVNATNQFCHNVSICYMDSNKNQSLSLGKVENMRIISQSQFLPMSIEFDNFENKTNIALTCDEEAISPKLIFKSLEGTVYNLELQSVHACVQLFSAAEGPTGGLSLGSVLVIMLLVFLLVYFGGGMLTLKLLRGAEGREMIPNIDFWMDLPYLVRDGVLFTINGFRPPASYDRI